MNIIECPIPLPLMLALRELLKLLTGRYPRAVVQGHRDFPDVAKACPCFDVRAWLKGGQ